MSKIKLCNNCKNNRINNKDNPNFNLWYTGYIWWVVDDCYLCPTCSHKLMDVDISSKDYFILEEISNEPEFIDAMVDLKEKDIVEFNLKMSQFRNQVEQQNVVKKAEEQKNVPHCPTCGSTNIKKISTTSKIGSVAMWGLLSRKVHKQWHCNNCKSEW